jgi:hypothetical protein
MSLLRRIFRQKTEPKFNPAHWRSAVSHSGEPVGILFTCADCGRDILTAEAVRHCGRLEIAPDKLQTLFLPERRIAVEPRAPYIDTWERNDGATEYEPSTLEFL